MFHCELNYDFETVKATVLEALASMAVPPSAVSTGWQCAPLIILPVFVMGTDELSNMYINPIGRRQVEDKLKW